MTGCEQKQGLLSLGSVGSGKHKHSNRKTHVAPKKINGAMHELKEYKSEGSVKTLLSAVQLSMIIQTDKVTILILMATGPILKEAILKKKNGR